MAPGGGNEPNASAEAERAASIDLAAGGEAHGSSFARPARKSRRAPQGGPDRTAIGPTAAARVMCAYMTATSVSRIVRLLAGQALVRGRRRTRRCRRVADLLRLDLLGRGVVERADEEARLRHSAGAAPASRCRSPSGRSAPSRPRSCTFGGLDVAVDDPSRVRASRAPATCSRIASAWSRSEPALTRAAGWRSGPADVAHRDVDEAVGVAGVVDRDDVRVVDRGDRLRLADEALTELVAADEVRAEGSSGQPCA